ncbi:single-stranded DNA-binding protein [Streptomyces palmae]|uniref:Single-stranded DNA-binding protein n=1 Tax=Streptomyces palmae TaxID=1701085 RepID=A0A4Z0HCS7_9ACTN|nr:single-stranded DNA-binding protein [Streptomyces palmae]TGB17806.1 single-stranded DNA-binding protein [Streptomyces palmae]
MSETLVTVVGNVATRPDFRLTAGGGVAVVRFRLAATARRWDRAREAWVDAHTSFYTVWAWRSLAENVAASVAVGEPLVVHGRLRVREERRDVRTGPPQPGEALQPPGAPEPGGGEGAGGVGGGDTAVVGRGGDGGVRWVSTEIEAVAVGHDLSRGTAAFRRVSLAKPQLTGALAP